MAAAPPTEVAAMAAAAAAAPLFHSPPLVGDVPLELEQAFVAWCLANGVEAPKFNYPAYDSYGLRGVIAREDISPGETLIRVPARLCLTSAVARADPTVGRVWDDPRVAKLFEADVDILMASYLAYMRTVAGEGSPLWPWVRTLPDVDTLADWRPVELRQLQDGALADEARIRDKELDERARTITGALTSTFPDFFPAEHYTPAWWRWAAKHLTARAFGRRVATVTMVPLADCMNHGPVAMKYEMIPEAAAGAGAGSHGSGSAASARLTGPVVADPASWFASTTAACSLSPSSSASSSRRGSKDKAGGSAGSAGCGGGVVEEEEEGDEYSGIEASLKASGGVVLPSGTFRIWLTRETAYKAGEQVMISYGRRSNAFLALEYGFVLTSNEWEEVSVTPRPVMATPSPGMAKVAGAALGLPPNMQALPIPAHATGLFAAIHSAGRPFKLGPNAWCAAALPAYRVAAADEGDVAAWKGGKALLWTRPVFRANEARALRLMSAHLTSCLEAHPTSIEQDEAALASGDVALALGPQAEEEGQGEPVLQRMMREGTAPTGRLPFRLWLAVTYRLWRKRILARHARVAAALAVVLEKGAVGAGAVAGRTAAVKADREAKEAAEAAAAGGGPLLATPAGSSAESCDASPHAPHTEEEVPVGEAPPTAGNLKGKGKDKGPLSSKQVTSYLKTGALSDALFAALAGGE